MHVSRVFRGTLLSITICLLSLSTIARGGENCKKYCDSFGMLFIPGPDTASEYSQGKGTVGYRTNSSGDTPSKGKGKDRKGKGQACYWNGWG